MGIIVNKENKNDELTRRINADLRTKMAESAAMVGGDDVDPDFVDDAEYVQDLKTTSRFGWMWIVLIVLALLSLISIVFL